METFGERCSRLSRLKQDGPGQDATGTEPAERVVRDEGRRRWNRRRITEGGEWLAKG